MDLFHSNLFYSWNESSASDLLPQLQSVYSIIRIHLNDIEDIDEQSKNWKNNMRLWVDARDVNSDFAHKLITKLSQIIFSKWFIVQVCLLTNKECSIPSVDKALLQDIYNSNSGEYEVYESVFPSHLENYFQSCIASIEYDSKFLNNTDENNNHPFYVSTRCSVLIGNGKLILKNPNFIPSDSFSHLCFFLLGFMITAKPLLTTIREADFDDKFNGVLQHIVLQSKNQLPDITSYFISGFLQEESIIQIIKDEKAEESFVCGVYFANAVDLKSETQAQDVSRYFSILSCLIEKLPFSLQTHFSMLSKFLMRRFMSIRTGLYELFQSDVKQLVNVLCESEDYPLYKFAVKSSTHFPEFYMEELFEFCEKILIPNNSQIEKLSSSVYKSWSEMLFGEEQTKTEIVPHNTLKSENNSHTVELIRVVKEDSLIEQRVLAPLQCTIQSIMEMFHVANTAICCIDSNNEVIILHPHLTVLQVIEYTRMQQPRLIIKYQTKQ